MAVNKKIGGGIFIDIDGDECKLRNALARANKEAQRAAADISKSIGGALTPGKTYKSSDDLARYIATARKAAESAKADFKGMEAPFRGMGRSIGVAEKDLAQFVSLQRRAFPAQAAKSFADNLKGVQRITGLGANEMNRLAEYLGGVGDECDRLNKTDGGISKLMSLIGKGGPIGIGVAVGGAALTAVRSGLETAMERDSIQRSLNAVMGSKEGGAEAFAFIKGEADRLGQSLAPLAESYRNLTSASQGTGISLETVNRLFTTVSEATVVSGMSTEQAARALTAFQKMASKGAISMEEMRNQLGEALPSTMRAIASGLGVSVQEVTSMVEEGTLSVNQLFEAFITGQGKINAAGLDEALSAAAIQMQMMRSAWDDLKAAFGAQFLDETVIEVNKTTETIKKFQPAAEVAGAAVAGLINYLGDLSTFFFGVSSEADNATAATARWVQAAKDISAVANQVGESLRPWGGVRVIRQKIDIPIACSADILLKAACPARKVSSNTPTAW